MHDRVADPNRPPVSIVKYSTDSWGVGDGSNCLGKGRLRIDSGEAVCVLPRNCRNTRARESDLEGAVDADAVEQACYRWAMSGVAMTDVEWLWVKALHEELHGEGLELPTELSGEDAVEAAEKHEQYLIDEHLRAQPSTDLTGGARHHDDESILGEALGPSCQDVDSCTGATSLDLGDSTPTPPSHGTQLGPPLGPAD
eukprot:7734343-Lingulodinium_polyedra.AAC.1